METPHNAPPRPYARTMAEDAGAAAPPGVDARSDLVGRLRSGSSSLASASARRMEQDLDWFAALSAEDRSWLGLVAQESIARFISWLEDPQSSSTNANEIFRVAPTELARAISLHQTVELIRMLVSVVEDHAVELVDAKARPLLREAVLLYSREVAFSAAEVYARAAESRGAWDARLEALAVDAIVRGASDESLRSRVSTLGWSGVGRTAVVVGTAPARLPERFTAELRHQARRLTSDALIGIQGDRVIAVLGADPRPESVALALAEHFGPGPVIVGPSVREISEAGRSARAAMAGMLAVPAWAKAPRPVMADDLLPERMLNGDPLARHVLIQDIYRPLVAAGTPLVETLDEYITQGHSLEGAARELYVHPNTVRYRLRRISQLVGWDPTDPREGYVLQTALAVGRLGDAGGSLNGR